MLNNKILIVEDEEKLAGLLKDFLEKSNFEISIVYRGDEVENWLLKNPTDLIILDLMLPGKDGIEICKSVRQNSNVPIIMATARVEEIDRLIGLEIGADDYICKPYSPREVVARVKAVLRRSALTKSSLVIDNDSQSEEAEENVLQLFSDKIKVKFNELTSELTKVEFNLLKKMVDHPGSIFSREQLMDSIYDHQHIVNDRTIDSHIKKLRKKLTKIGMDPNPIHSVYGLGYKFD
ncbi:MAG: two-component system response regulator BaeR [Kangiella sp.]|nr:MAG: two-component system response regulator BaeR [Kangiella sp.]